MMRWVGWLAAAILLLTIGRQVWTQWRSGTAAGVSRFLFTGQTAASVCFIAYSASVGDPVFIATNTLMLVAAILGEAIYWRNKRRDARAPRSAEMRSAES